MSLKEKVALVTGASRGIGRAIALELAQEGANVVGTATSASGAEKITAAFAEAGLQGRGMELDVTQADSVKDVFETIKAELGAPAILVNNAAITKDNIMLRMKDEQWSSVIETNLNAVYRLSKTCMKDMVKARWGRIINVSSVVASTGNLGQANYVAAKAGVIGFSKSLAIEVATRGITVNVVSPGFIDTDMTKAIPEEYRERILAMVPTGKVGEPEDIANAVCFLASPKASYITGTTLHVNGGMYMA